MVIVSSIDHWINPSIKCIVSTFRLKNAILYSNSGKDFNPVFVQKKIRI